MRGGRQIGGPRLKGLLSRVAGLSLHWLAGLPTHDATNAFRAYRRSVLVETTDREPRGVRVLARDHRQGVRRGPADHRGPLDLARPLGRPVAVQAPCLAAPLSPLVFLRPVAPATAPSGESAQGITARTVRSHDGHTRRSISENVLVRQASDGHGRRGVPGPAPGPAAGASRGEGVRASPARLQPGHARRLSPLPAGASLRRARSTPRPTTAASGSTSPSRPSSTTPTSSWGPT